MSADSEVVEFPELDDDQIDKPMSTKAWRELLTVAGDRFYRLAEIWEADCRDNPMNEISWGLAPITGALTRARRAYQRSRARYIYRDR